MSTREHGSYVKFKVDGCRCQPCRDGETRYRANRSRAIAYGTWQPYVDAEPVREHMRVLNEFGIGWMRLADLADVPRGTVSKLLYGDPKRNMGPSKRLLPKNANALLAIEPTLDNLADRAFTDGTGTRRRLQALVAAGWPQTRLADRIGVQNFNKMICGDQPVRASTARAAIALYDELWRVDPRDHGVRDHVAARTRRIAIEHRWAPVGAWDDDTIDDPAAFPDWTGHCGTPAGYPAHYRMGGPVCEPCRTAHRNYRAQLRATAAA